MGLVMPLFGSFLMVVLVGWQAQTGPVPSDTAKWSRFSDEAQRVSFAYPSALRPVISPAEELRGLQGWVRRVSLVADDPRVTAKLPVLAVSVFVCDDSGLNPCFDENFYRKVCDRFAKFPLGDATAIQCVSYGRAACQWSAVVLRKKGRVLITSPAGDSDANAGTNERAACADRAVAIRTRSPVKELLASFRLR
jgi:hypothetical protein